MSFQCQHKFDIMEVFVFNGAVNVKSISIKFAEIVEDRRTYLSDRVALYSSNH